MPERTESGSSDQPDDDLTLAPLEDVRGRIPRRARVQRAVGVLAACALIAAAVAVPLALHDQSHSTKKQATKKHATKHNQVSTKHGALEAVAAAIDKTTGSGSFSVTYSLTATPGTAPTTTGECLVAIPNAPGDTGPQQRVECPGGAFTDNVTTTGTATIDVDPFAMKAVSNVSSLGAVTVVVNNTTEWEDVGAEANPENDAGTPIPQFSGLVEGTLGRHKGAVAMMSLSSPTGYLSITEQAITAASQVGTGSVGGVPVTVYRVSVNPDLLAQVPGLSTEEGTAINDALGVLHSEGFTGNTTDISIDANGFVLATHGVNNFADGGSVVVSDTFSTFGCAGTVQVPGDDTAPPATPPTCADPPPPATAATTTTGAGSTTTVPDSTTTAPDSTTTTSTPASTTTTS